LILGVMVAAPLLIALKAWRAVGYHPAIMPTISAPVDSNDPGKLLSSADALVTEAQSNLKTFSDIEDKLRARQATVASEISDATAFREHLGTALWYGQNVGSWPIAVANYQFNQLKEIDAAMGKTDHYLQHATQIQTDVYQKNGEVVQFHRHAERMMQTMLGLRQQMTYTRSIIALQVSVTQLQDLIAGQQKILSQAQQIDADPQDLRPFSLAE
jgi:hypothetical protein